MLANNRVTHLGHCQSQGDREYQQDTYGFGGFNTKTQMRQMDRGVLLVLADGMGGHVGGEIASSICVNEFFNAFEASEETLITGRLAYALEAANSAIYQRVHQEPALADMGCTLIALHYSLEGWASISVGDSPMWICRREDFDRINRDHSMREVLEKAVAEGQLTVEQAETHPHRNALRSAITGEPLDIRNPDSVHILGLMAPLRKGEKFILASDGLETLRTEEIEAIVRENATDCQAIAEKLIATVNGMGVPGQDNTTVIVFGPPDVETEQPAKSDDLVDEPTKMMAPDMTVDFNDDEDSEGFTVISSTSSPDGRSEAAPTKPERKSVKREPHKLYQPSQGSDCLPEGEDLPPPPLAHYDIHDEIENQDITEIAPRIQHQSEHRYTAKTETVRPSHEGRHQSVKRNQFSFFWYPVAATFMLVFIFVWFFSVR